MSPLGWRARQAKIDAIVREWEARDHAASVAMLRECPGLYIAVSRLVRSEQVRSR